MGSPRALLRRAHACGRMGSSSEHVSFRPPPPYDAERRNSDMVARNEHIEMVGREMLVQIGRKQNIQEKLRQCWLREGVNHYENCRELAHKYKEATEAVGMGWKYSYTNHAAEKPAEE